MSAGKVGRRDARVKLMFDWGDAQEFPLERLMEELGLEMRALATTSGLLMMRSIMKAEEEFLAGPRGTRGTEVNRWCKDSRRPSRCMYWKCPRCFERVSAQPIRSSPRFRSPKRSCTTSSAGAIPCSACAGVPPHFSGLSTNSDDFAAINPCRS